MHAQLILSVYVFATVFVFLGGICVLTRLLVRRRYFRDPPDVLRGLDPCASCDEFDRRAVEQRPLMPPPLPKNEFEFYQAGQYAMDQNLPPLPSPPPAHERDNW